ncbi:unnamed protein product [Paramecium octaurelia]|uniref:Transmembrane protein n=1 Tax=Paramecium octaurelia TaxID=43137 RepID=A0A8S1X1P3_PAROT|nr:unnamed protein product [Paramecium octaurelia]
MMRKNYIILVTLFILNFQLAANQVCKQRQARLYSILRGKYYNVLNQNRGGIISSKLSNSFAGGIQGSCIRDNTNYINGSFGYTACGIGLSIIFDLVQQYQLNTLKIWLWDQDDRFYRIKVYLIYNDLKTQIYESNFAQQAITITFSDQQVQQFQIYNVNGNTYNVGLHNIKLEAYYKIQTIL